MSRSANFQVDPRLAMLLGETYRSSEQAIKELVDNSWDADAENVWITLPDPMTLDPVVVRDDGSGMTEKEVRQDYLKIARDRRASKGERTVGKGRIVKGRKGIGKFAGLMVADVMALDTRAGGHHTRLTIPKEDLLQAVLDLEKFPLDVQSVPCSSEEQGTNVTLSSLQQNRSFPDPERLKQLLVLEYGREAGFTIRVNDSQVGIEDVPGTAYAVTEDLPGIGPANLRFSITADQRPAKQSGIVMRVGGKIIGKPSHFGLDTAEDIPRKLLRRVYGEIEVDGLAQDVTADWAGIIENSNGFRSVTEFVRQTVQGGLQETFKREMNLAKGRLKQSIDRRLATMPEYRRDFAYKAIERIMQRFYDFPEEHLQPVISVVLDALERDEYWQVLQSIDRARHEDVGMLAEALHEFGILELSMVAKQTRHRLSVLDEFDLLIANGETKEQVVHNALATNLWILGAEFALMASNKTLASVVAHYCEQHFAGERANRRPDLLLLSAAFGQRYTLVEFKRPSHTIGRSDLSQAEQYRDDLIIQFQPIDVWVVGKDYDPPLLINMPNNLRLASYAHLISKARQELSWLLNELVPVRAEAEPA